MKLSGIARGSLYACLALLPACGSKPAEPSPVVSQESIDSVASEIDSKFVRIRDNQIDHLISAHNYSRIPSFDGCDPCRAYSSCEGVGDVVRDSEVDASLVKLRVLQRGHAAAVHREILPFYSGCDVCSLYSSMDSSRDLVEQKK